ncbi:alpha-ribazole phosphatase [Flaviaesturariibacter flavus]|uniref:Alpha-ribazole phosphatase n=1 Tax=Flaviaesturariibacter flavus TaxID=2502780 RepID=A0A4R1BBB8_9BACT|nr:alpha-ribazole phosphatase [Flaviaesturariibacter flavus]TCJ14247.1 alpha-ribazole phosphatase [Flaviaesturariibacter flavus]
MEIYLIRHTTPDVAPGTCYGQADLGVTESFDEEAAAIVAHLPPHVAAVYSSPLQRCRRLAERLFPGHAIRFDDRLKEISCGHWELRSWDDIEPAPLQAWMDDFVHVCIPGGESYMLLYERVIAFLQSLPDAGGPVAVVTHGGVIRSVLAHINDVPLRDSFDAFPIHYGCTVHLHRKGAGLGHRFLHNVKRGVERHRPVREQDNKRT